MNKLNKWVKSILATAALTPAFMVQSASAFEMRSEVDLATGYRHDTARFEVEATTAGGATRAVGESKYKNVHLWQMGLYGVGAFNDHWYARGGVNYGRVLGGDVRDTVADLVSNPLNNIQGPAAETACGCDDSCASSSCASTSCGLPLQDDLVTSRAALKGHAWDATLAVGYMFHVSEEFGLAPVVGWSYNAQNLRWKHVNWGPVAVTSQCTAMDTPECVSFCTFDDTSYRARWNGPFIGVDMVYEASPDWTVRGAYELHFANFKGKFSTLGGSEGDCCASSSSDSCGCSSSSSCGGCKGINFLRGCDDTCVSMNPQTIRASSRGYCNVFMLGFDYHMNHHWDIGLDFAYKLFNAHHQKKAKPCTSCDVACRDLPDGTTVADSPIYADAEFRRAKWHSFQAEVNLGYSF